MIAFRAHGVSPQDRPGQRLLFTPGPLTTTQAVRDAMRIDIGSRDAECTDLVTEIRSELWTLAGSRRDLTCTLVQGSGTYGVEAVIGSAIPRDSKLLVLVNGAYGRRIRAIAQALGIATVVVEDPENVPHDPAAVERALARDPAIGWVGCVHCETTSGVLNPIRAIGQAVQRQGRRLFVDAISSFGAYPVGPGEAIDFDAGPIDFLVGSANKCIEGVPGFAFVLARREALERCKGQARSLCLDLYDQWAGFEKTGSFRFTPPTHVLLAFRQALRELAAEGGIAERARRYRDNQRFLVEGMTRLGLACYVPAAHQSSIITTFRYPSPGFDFDRFYQALHARGLVIYPGKLTGADTFRIGSIGSIGRGEIALLLEAIAGLLERRP